MRHQSSKNENLDIFIFYPINRLNLFKSAMRTVTHLDVFVASPSDVGPERELMDKIINEINLSWSRNLGIHLDLIRWETHTHAGFGEDAQDVINKQLPQKIDLFIGILWNRFGTPTKRADSGTEEEFLRAYKQYQEDGTPELRFYFNRTPADAHRLDIEQVAKVKNFRQKIAELGGYHNDYTSIDAFEKLMHRSLVSFIQNYQNNISKSGKGKQTDYFKDFNKMPGFVDILADIETFLPIYQFHMEKVDEECFSYVEKLKKQNEIANTSKSFVKSKVATDQLAEETLFFAASLREHYGTGLDLISSCLSRFPDAIALIRQKDSDHTQQSLKNTIQALHKIAPDFELKTESLKILKDTVGRAPIITQNLKNANDQLYYTLRQLFERSEITNSLINNSIEQISTYISTPSL